MLAHVLSGGTLSESDARGVFESILTGQWEQSQIGALLALIQSRGVKAEELTGAARVMRAHVTRVPIPPELSHAVVLDTCGTGGTPKTFNVSTAAAFVVAGAAGPNAPTRAGRRVVAVAKHGNRGRSGRGSAEVLKALGVNVDASPEVQSKCLARAGVCFCFAINHHPAMKHAAPVRQALGFPTLFNLLGPLTNPAAAPRQVTGVFRPEYVPLVAQTLASLGAERAMVLHSADGMDEISIYAPTHAAIVRAGTVTLDTIDGPKILGRGGTGTVAAISAATLDDAARFVSDVLDGKAGDSREIVVLNAAAALMVADAAATWDEGLLLAREAIDSGRANAALGLLREAAK